MTNLSLEETELQKHTYVGIASPTQSSDTDYPDEQGICVVQRGPSVTNQSLWEFDEYLQEKLSHLTRDERRILEPVLRRYCYLFYGFGSIKYRFCVDYRALNAVTNIVDTLDSLGNSRIFLCYIWRRDTAK